MTNWDWIIYLGVCPWETDSSSLGNHWLPVVLHLGEISHIPYWHANLCGHYVRLVWITMLLRLHGCNFPGKSKRHYIATGILIFQLWSLSASLPSFFLSFKRRAFHVVHYSMGQHDKYEIIRACSCLLGRGLITWARFFNRVLVDYILAQDRLSWDN